MRRRDFIVSLPLSGVGLAAGTTLPSISRAAESRPVVIAFPLDIQSWDPVVRGTPDATAITRCVWDQPLELAPDLKFTRSIVTHFKWLDTDAKTLALDFRQGVTFQNGDKLTSDDFKFTFFDRVKADKTTLLAAVWHGVEGIETPSPTKAIMHFSNPMVTAPVMLADIPAYILPRAYYEKVGHDGFVAKPIGSGPFRLMEYERGARIVLGAYEGYWRGPAKIKRLIFQIVKDPVTRAAAIQSGQADIATSFEVREVERLGNLPGLAKYLDPTTSITFIQMVNEGVLKDKNLRLACHHALDKAAISRVLFDGHATPVWLPAGPGMADYVPGFKIKYDPKQAEALLAKSGYSLAKPARFNFYTTKGVFPADYDMARIIVEMWRKVGIEVDLQPLEAAQFAEYMRKARFDGPVLKAFHPAAGDPATYSGFMLDPKSYLSIWKSNDIPPRLYPLLHEVDDKKRIKGFQAFDMWAVEQGYSIPMFLGLSTVVAKKSLHFVPYRTGILNPYSWSQPS